MEKFIDREMEMDTLQSEYERNGSALVILYGRRRVGKTTLISEFIKDKNALFCTLDSIFAGISNNVIQSAKLASLRDTLLPRLMSGELDVSDIDH